METELFLGFNIYAWITIATVLGVFTTLLFTKLRADVVFLAAMGVLLVTGANPCHRSLPMSMVWTTAESPCRH